MTLKCKIEVVEIKTKINGAVLFDINYDLVYSKIEVNNLLALKQNVLGFTPIPNTRKINNKALTADVNLTLDDIPSGSGYVQFSAANLAKLNGIANGANNYVHPSTHNADIIVESSSKRFVSDAEKSAWNGKANVSQIPTALSQLSSSENFRLVSDTEKANWNSKASGTHNHNDLYYTETETNALLANKQNTLVSGTNIKTVNNQSLLGTGNIVIEGGGTLDHATSSNRDLADQHPINAITGLETALNAKEPANANIQSHISNTDIHVTTTDKSNWDGKAETADIPTDINELTDTSGVLSSLHTHSNKADLDNYNPSNFASSGHNHTLAGLSEKSYNSLTDKPSIPTALSDLTKDINFDERYYTESETNTLLSGKENTFNKNTAFNKNFGSTADTVCEGNDARLSDARTPTSHNHNDLYYTESEIDSLLSSKSDTSHNHNLANLAEKSYNSLTDKPTLFSGSYADLTNKPKLTFGVQIKSSEDIPTGSKFIRSFANAGAIKKWSISSVESGSIEFDIKKAAYADLPNYTSIATVKPNLSSQTKNTANVNWAFNAGDFIEITVHSNSGIKNVVLSMEIE